MPYRTGRTRRTPAATHMEGLMIVAKATRNPGVLQQLGPVVERLLHP